MPAEDLTPWLTIWNLTPDGDPIVRGSSRLLPVRQRGVPAMLKVASSAEERAGGALMACSAGRGAARVLAHGGAPLLLERAEGQVSPAHFAPTRRDDEATRIICDVVATLHASSGRPPPPLIPLAA